MLTELYIKNFAIIDELRVSFGEGLNVISGETGAGKSIIIGAISLLMGDRASSDMIRSSEETATVEASFHIAGMDFLRGKLKDMDLFDGDDLILRRTISRSGKNKVYVNGGMANLAVLSSLCEPLLNVCGQREHQVILNKETHIDVLDDFAGLQEFRKEYGELYESYLSLQSRLEELERQMARRRQEEELHSFQLKEIADADIKDKEDEALLEEKKLITHARKLLDYAEGAYERLYGKEGSVLEEMGRVIGAVKEIKKIDGGMKIDEDALQALYYQIEDHALTLRNYGKALSFDPQRLGVVEERLELLARLKRKYGGSLETVLNKKASLEQALKDLSGVSEGLEQTRIAISEVRSKLQEKAINLSNKRRKAAISFQTAIEAEIHTLKMDGATFQVHFSQPHDRDDFHAKGIDTLEFYLSANRGEELKPLVRIASGGELSRLILALKKVLAGSATVGTMIFDEVDSGIGGATAEIMGTKLRDVARYSQVLCITHLPQIACFADRHFLVSKAETEGRTNATVHPLSEEERLNEITRMLTGVELTEKARDHAKEMLHASRPSQ